MTISRPRRLAIAGGALVVGLSAVTVIAPTQASASDRGLFGSQSPVYDGVYRQGLAITGLAATDNRIPRAAVRWLRDQQCPNGSFTSYRADTSEPCAKPDPVAYEGQDTNATAMAAMALSSAGRSAEARAAVRYLRKQQNPDGGFPWFRGGDSDTNSTGLVLSAVKGIRPGGLSRLTADATSYLAEAQLRCDAPASQRGLLQFQLGANTPDALGSGQGAVGLVTTLPVQTNRTAGAKVTCPRDRTPVAAGLLSALAKQLRRNDGLIPSSFDSGPDISSTANAVLALTAARYAGGPVRTSVRALQDEARGYVVTGRGKTRATVPGAAGTLLLVTAATGSDPQNFGGLDLAELLLDSRQ